jgi:hypothetical protein
MRKRSSPRSGAAVIAPIVLAIVGAFLGLYAFDAYLVVTADPRAAIYHVSRLHAGYDRRDRWEVAVDLRQHGIEAYPAVYPNGLSPFETATGPLLPLGGVSRVRTALCNETGQYVTYTSDRFGFNNPDSAWDRSLLLMAVGDSFAQGFCPPADRHMLSLLRQRIPGTINLGQSASGPLAELATLREYGPVFKPAVVLWFFFEGNDLLDLEDEKVSPVYQAYLKGPFSQHLTARQPEIDRLLKNYIDADIQRRTLRPPSDHGSAISAGRHMLDIAMLRHVRQLLKKAGERQDTIVPDYELLFRVLERAKATTSEWGGRLVFVYLPQSGYRYYGVDAPDMHRRLMQLVRRSGIDLIDIKDAFGGGSAPDRYFYFPGSHYNEAGNQVIADAVYRYLQVSSVARPKTDGAAPP